MAIIHQALHGYQRGHKLLAASLPLPEAADQLMLVLSDLSGTREAPGYETYLTGYPLDDTSMYAFARTWMAPELSRPGCVWTHTLLVPLQSVGQLEGRILNRLFKRPVTSNDFGLYEGVLRAPTVSHDLSEGSESAGSVIQTLYEFPDHTTWVASESSSEFEPLVLGIWDQQWADLKRGFTFSTGSLSPRRIQGNLIDLQIVPNAQISSWDGIKGTRSASRVRSLQPWARTAAADLGQPGSFREWLRQVGVGGRENFATIAKLYELTEPGLSSKRFELYFDAIDSLVAPARDRNRLKANLLKDGLGGSDYDVLRYVISKSDLADDVVRASAIRRRLTRLAKANGGQLWELGRVAAAENSTPGGTEFISTFAETLTPEDLLERSDGDLAVVLMLVTSRPVLAASPEMWKVSPHTQILLLDALRQSQLDSTQLRSVLTAVLLSGSELIWERASEEWPTEAVDVLLTSVANSSVPVPRTDTVRRLLEHHSPAVSQWAEGQPSLSVSTLLLFADALAMDAMPKNVGINDWLRLAQSEELSTAGVRVHTALLRIGLTASSSRAGPLI